MGNSYLDVYCNYVLYHIGEYLDVRKMHAKFGEDQFLCWCY